MGGGTINPTRTLLPSAHFERPWAMVRATGPAGAPSTEKQEDVFSPLVPIGQTKPPSVGQAENRIEKVPSLYMRSKHFILYQC